MDNPEVSVHVEHLEEEKTKRSVIHVDQCCMLRWWKYIFAMSRVLAVFVDPLFLYIPITNEDIKCLKMDQNLKMVTLSLRSAMDLPCIVSIITQILAAISRWRSQSSPRAQMWRRVNSTMRRRSQNTSWSYFLIDVLAILPIPQVVVLVLLARMNIGSQSLSVRKFLNFLIVFQYFPRFFRMHLSCNVNNRETNRRHQIWFKAWWLRVYKFILATHVLGAFWYFFSIQREMDCWQYACRRENKCEDNTFECGGNHTFKNITLLNDLCPISTPNQTLFNFGIFLPALQTDILRSTDFPQKFLHCSWWALRSLSSFGQDLQTSTYAWENIFALGISVLGMILFLIYLSAILQDIRNRIQFSKERKGKIKMKMKEVELWLTRKGLPSNLKAVIMHIIQQKLQQNKDVPVDDLLSFLPSAHCKYILRCLALATIKKVPMLQTMGVRLLKAITEHLEPVDYVEDGVIIQEGERLHKMIFITHGTVLTYKTNSKGGKYGSEFLERGDYYGAEELLNWASKFSSSDDLPVSTRMVKPVTKVEVLELSADDLKSIAFNYWWNFTKKKDLKDFNQTLLEDFAKSSIEKAIRRLRQTKKKRTISSLNKLVTSQGSASKKWQRLISMITREELPSPVAALDGK